MVKKRQPLAPTPRVPENPKGLWGRVKSWFLNSEVIFLSRLATFSGVVTTFVGTLDFSPLWSVFTTGTDFTQQQLIFIGVGILGAGVTFELARRRNATDL